MTPDAALQICLRWLARKTPDGRWDPSAFAVWGKPGEPNVQYMGRLAAEKLELGDRHHWDGDEDQIKGKIYAAQSGFVPFIDWITGGTDGGTIDLSANSESPGSSQSNGDLPAEVA